MFFGIWAVVWRWAVGFNTDEGPFLKHHDGWEFSLTVICDDGRVDTACDGDCDGCDCL